MSIPFQVEVELAHDNPSENNERLILFELIFLGTSASAPSVHRGLSAQVIKHDEHRFLIDCGEGTQRQILKSGMGFKHLNRILITHSHLDHILGLGGLLSTLMRWETIGDLEIAAGEYALDRIRDLLLGVVLRGLRPPIDLRFRKVEPGMLYDEPGFTVEAFPVRHRGPDCFGYVFQERSHRPFLVEKAEALGIPPGPWRRDLVNGLEARLPDGRTIYPEQVLGDVRRGTRLVYIGDTGHTSDLLPFAMGADTLVIEATYLKTEEDMAQKFAHLTAEKAAELARDAHVGSLILTHLSRRYRERDVLDEARAVFPNTRIARDFDTYQIKRGSATIVER